MKNSSKLRYFIYLSLIIIGGCTTGKKALQKGDYDKAIQPLIWLTSNIKKKRKKARYNYILAQIYQMRQDNALAVEHYKKVLKGRPDYRMAFNAKMSMARIASQDNSMDQKDIVKLLKKMLKENKTAFLSATWAAGKACDYLLKFR